MTIPKIFFTYWEGNQLSILHYYTIVSLLKHNPEIDIIIYSSVIDSNILVQWTSPEHKNKLNKTIPLELILNIDKTRIKLIKIDFEKEYDINTNISCVFKADFVRICKLYEHGGMWFDMDLLFIKPFPKYLFDSDVDFFYFRYNDVDVIPTGLLCSTPKNELLSSIYSKAIQLIKNVNFLDNYQKIGPHLWTIHINAAYVTCNMVSLCETKIYPYTWLTISKFFKNSDNSFIKENTFCIHWFNGGEACKEFLNNFDEYNIIPERSICDFILSQLDPPIFKNKNFELEC